MPGRRTCRRSARTGRGLMLNRHARALFAAIFSPVAPAAAARSLTRRRDYRRHARRGGRRPDRATRWGSCSGAPLLSLSSSSPTSSTASWPVRWSTRGRWGDFLDSTLDRVGDGAVFAGIVVWFFTGGDNHPSPSWPLVCLVLGSVVSYAGPGRGAGMPRQRGHRRALRAPRRPCWWPPGWWDWACRTRSCWWCCACWPSPAW